jgi:hypothetical protein
MVIIYLAATLLLQSCCLPFNVATCVTLDEPPSTADIRGITAHKVYPINALLQKPVSSYLTFSPWPFFLSCFDRLSMTRKTVVIFCGTFFPKNWGRPLTGVLLFAVRTFLSKYYIGTITRLIEYKCKI